MVRWLGEQLDEDERIASGCSGTEWWEHPKNWVSAPPLNRVALVVHDGDRAHIIRHGPARVLREIDAKRAIVDDLAKEIRWGARKGPDYLDGIDSCERTLKRLALPYAERPGYRDEWRP
ncbi:DUF6221 family protein [Streptomyces sp. YIM S03343]